MYSGGGVGNSDLQPYKDEIVKLKQALANVTTENA